MCPTKIQGIRIAQVREAEGQILNRTRDYGRLWSQAIIPDVRKIIYFANAFA